MTIDLFPEDIGKGSRNWGMPYMGSKNEIAWEVVQAMPKADVFVDLFCGGCAITHAAIVSKRWNRFVLNDIRPTADAFIRSIFTDLKEYERCVTRAEFKQSEDIIVKMLWSFGNDCSTYLWGSDIEQIKCNAVRMLTAKTLKERHDCFMRFVRDIENYKGFLESLQRLQRLNSLQSLQRLQRLNSLQSLQHLQRLNSLQSLQRDYMEVEIPRGSVVVYCDIPYKNTSGYCREFDHEKFYKWFGSLDVPAFISEYDAPFTLVAQFNKRVKKSANGKNSGTIEGLEKLYFNGTREDYARLMEKGV